MARECSLESCSRKHLAKGYCQLHYQRFLKTGDPMENVRELEHHGMEKTREYAIWRDMRQRCNNPNDYSYEFYGGRGIKVCERWDKSFIAFFADMGKRPSKDHSIDRIDNYKGYEPDNCRWATRFEQDQNKRTTVRWNGKTTTEWAMELGIPKRSFRSLVQRHSTKYAVSFYQRKAKLTKGDNK